MDYNAVEISVPSDKIDILSGELLSWGTTGIEEKQTANGNVRIIAYFPGGNSSWKPELQELVSRFGGTATIASVANEDWARSWRQNFPPNEIVPGLTIAPSWENKKPDKDTIVLDPGMAFGTGTHETTRMCAHAIFDCVSEKGQQGEKSKNGKTDSSLSLRMTRTPYALSFLDIGTGSGILSMIADRMGIKDITAVDNDPEAVKIARENFEINNVSAKLSEEVPNKKFDIIVANILLLPLIEMSKKIISLLNKNGVLILSGITCDQKDELLKAFAELTFVKEYNEGEWSAVILESA